MDGKVVAKIGYDWSKTAHGVQLTSELPYYAQTRIADIGSMLVSSQTEPNSLWAAATTEISRIVPRRELS
jgi:hypothetical protein